MLYAAGDLPDEWRSTPGTRGAHARFGTFRRLTGYNMPDIFDFTYWLGPNSNSGDSGAATGEVAGTGWTITEYIKALIWQLRKLRSDYEEYKTLLRDLESQHTTHAAATLGSFTQVRGILDHLRADGLALRAELVAARSESVHGATLAALSGENEALKAEQERLLRITDALRTELLDVNAKILGDSATTLLLSREIEELKAGQVRLQRQLDAQVAEQHVLATFATDSVEEDFADRLATVETAQHEHGRVVTRVEQESDRTLQVILRVNQLESDVNMVLLPYTHCHGAPA